LSKNGEILPNKKTLALNLSSTNAGFFFSFESYGSLQQD
jgi:hypothetical protein